MVGNDIVDLREANKTPNWQHPRFLSKLFTELEQDLINNSDNPFVRIWRLWSMKEAAYKVYTQNYSGRFFNPKGFECSLENTFGAVKFKNFKCFVESRATSNFIISEAKTNQENFKSKVVSLSGNSPKLQSSQLKKSLLEHLGNTISSKANIQLKYTRFGVPFVEVENKLHHISLTHHGRFGAFAIA
jgi:phosphopantetheinyl transferase (holo-ACP synthase)